ncbi:MAG: imidazole glycerol phosphate synthase subunit HisH [Pseudomonadales bacterium]|nr:imidazole glycerol phosphate synthase subunit HisH [Pseudomonadales bacterium]
MSKNIAIIDYGMGNLHSVASAVEHVCPDSQINITADAKIILEADHVILPGVGAIRDCMHEIRRLKVDETVQQVIKQKQPLLGVCVGMQALMTHSEENGGIECLNYFPGEVKLFQGDQFTPGHAEHLKVPHMGWNNVEQLVNHAVFHGIASDTRFYFVHSFYAQMNEHAIGACEYGPKFAAMLAKDNVVAVQFHPEKSHQAGLRLIRNFLNWDGQ